MNATATSTLTAAGTTGGRQQLVVFPLAGEHYALPIGTVSEIIRSTRLRSIVSASRWVEGIIAVRGKIIPIYDLATRLGLSLDGEATKVVIVEATTEQLGIPADDATRYSPSLPTNSKTSPPAVAKPSNRSPKLVTGS